MTHNGTGNCQLCIIGYAKIIVESTHHKRNDEKYNDMLADDIVRAIKSVGRRQVLIDIEERLEKEIVDIFSRHSDDYFEIFNIAYENSTGTPMKSIMFKWDECDLDSDHPDYEDNY